MNDNEVTITLSRSQVERVVDLATHNVGTGGLPELLFAHRNGDWTVADFAADPTFQDRGISQTLLLGLFVLASFPDNGAERGVRMLAGVLGMAPSTAYRFLKTLVAIGLLERNPMTREYRLASR